ncbi:MAG: type II CAAX endopeptidase family protein [Syntrophomonas sp.]
MLERPRWGFADIIVVYLTIMGSAVIGALFPVKAGISDIQYFLFLFGVQFVATVFFVYLFAVLLKKGKWCDLGMRKAKPEFYWHYGIKGGFLLIIMVLLMGYVLKYFQPELQMQEIEEMLRSANRLPDILAIVFAGTVLAPVSEELFYRGMIYPLFRRHLGPAWGAILAGLIFGLAHWDLWRALPLAIGGAALCYIYEKSGSILVPMVAHGVWNGSMFALIYLSLYAGTL